MLIFFLLFALVLTKDEDIDFGPDTVRLTQDTFQDFVAGGKPVFVEFYAPWCGHCKKSGPEISEFSKMVKDKLPEAGGVGVVNCIDNVDICADFEIQGYPTIKIFVNGIPKEFEGQRTAAGFFAALKRFAAGLLTEAPKYEEFEKLELPVVIGFFGEEKNRFLDGYNDVALNLIDVTMYVSKGDHGEYGKHFDIKEGEQAIFIKNEDGVRKITEEEVTVIDLETLTSVIDDETAPPYAVLDENTFQKLSQKGLPFLMLFIDFSDEQLEKYKEDLLLPLAEQFEGKFTVVYTDSSRFGSQWEMMGGEADYEFPGMGIFTDGKKNYLKTKKPEDFFGFEEIKEWATGVLDGTVKPAFKSEPIPESQDEPVYVVVGNTYEDLILKDQSRDKFIKFYAPWCGHCKQLAPIWVELAEALKSVDDKLLIAEFDATTNTNPDESVDVEGFPTLLYYKQGVKVPLTYGGGRNLKEFSEFILENGSEDVVKAVKQALEDSDIKVDFGSDL